MEVAEKHIYIYIYKYNVVTHEAPINHCYLYFTVVARIYVHLCTCTNHPNLKKIENKNHNNATKYL
jgi:hypothetical protein